MRGRKPKPTSLKRLAGNPGCRPLNDNEPQPPISEHTPYVPRFLNDEAKREWRRIIKILVGLGLYTEVDRAALAMYCQAWGRWVEMERKVQEHGAVMKTTKGNLIQNPYLAVANRAWEQLRKILAEFGLTPSSRTRLTVNTEAREPTLAEVLFARIDGSE